MLKKNDFIQKLKEARSHQLMIDRRMGEIFRDYNFEDVHFRADNSDNLAEAINCYIHYGELPLSGNIEDFWNAYKKAVEEEEKKYAKNS